MQTKGRESHSGGGTRFFLLTMSVLPVIAMANDRELTINNDWQDDDNMHGLLQDESSFEGNSSVPSDEDVDNCRSTTDVDGHQRARPDKVADNFQKTLTSKESSRVLHQGQGIEKKEWILPLQDMEMEPKHVIPVLHFQEDSITSADTYALLNGTTVIPDLQNFSLCLWVRVYYWRESMPIVSYAISVEKDNALLLALTREGFRLILGDIIHNHQWDKDIAHEIEWIHVCVIVYNSEHSLYVNGGKVLQEKNNYISKKKNESHLSAALEGGGTVVLGQDQDKHGEGFDRRNSFSGTIGGLQLLSETLDQNTVMLLHQGQTINQMPLLDLNNPNWYLQNVRMEKRVLKSFYESQKGKFFVFFTKEKWGTTKIKCKDLGGSLASYSTIPYMLISLNHYFIRMGKMFRKVDVAFNPGNGIAKYNHNSLRITWEAGKYIKAFPVLTSNKIAYACHIKTQSYIRLHGLPDDSDYIVDKLFKIKMYQGSNVLRGIQKSYIDYKENEWCIRSTGENAGERIFCLHSESDQLPLGRRMWEQEGREASYLVLLTSCSKNQFTCDSGFCIPLRYRCNTYDDCLDGSDEKSCTLLPQNTLRSMTRAPLKPLSISGSILIINIPEVNLNSNFFSTTLWINATWRDERLYMLNLKDDVETVIKDSYLLYNVWSPKWILKPLQSEANTFMTTATVTKSCEGEQRIYGAFEDMGIPSTCFGLWKRVLLQVTWQREFNLKKFPFEVIDCPIHIQLDDCQLWDYVNVTLPYCSHLPYMVTLESYSHTGSTVDIRLQFRRQAGGYIVNTFIPIIILNIISFYTFLFDEKDFTNRIMVTVSLLIVVASLSKQTANSLPNTSYTKCIDLVFLSTIISLSFVFASHVICSFIWIWRNRRHALVMIIPMEDLSKKNKERDSKRMNIIAMCLCILAGLICTIICVNSCI